VGKHLPDRASGAEVPDWKQANPRWISRALEKTQTKPCGGWYVLDASRLITEKPRCLRVLGHALVAWRANGRLMVAPNECPHMGASLESGRVRNGKLVCPWHGLELGARPHGSWKPFPSYDDGVLVWVQMTGEHKADELSDHPILCERPETSVHGVIRVEARCEPRDVIANRLDPWHGVHFHPYSFARLRVLEQNDDDITVRVAKRIGGPLSIEVDARFHCPDPRTIVMTIVAGEGVGSVVETHATPIEADKTAIIEATIATSERLQFKLAKLAPGLVRPLIERMARRLWVDDAAYAERLFSVRKYSATDAKHSS